MGHKYFISVGNKTIDYNHLTVPFVIVIPSKSFFEIQNKKWSFEKFKDGLRDCFHFFTFSTFAESKESAKPVMTPPAESSKKSTHQPPQKQTNKKKHKKKKSPTSSAAGAGSGSAAGSAGSGGQPAAVQKTVSVDKLTGEVEEDEDCSAEKCLKPSGMLLLGRTAMMRPSSYWELESFVPISLNL